MKDYIFDSIVHIAVIIFLLVCLLLKPERTVKLTKSEKEQIKKELRERNIGRCHE